jgi:hypothetical protein
MQLLRRWLYGTAFSERSRQLLIYMCEEEIVFIIIIIVVDVIVIFY